MNPNIEVRVMQRKGGRWRNSKALLEETKPKNLGKGGAKPTIPKFKVMQLDLYLNTT